MFHDYALYVYIDTQLRCKSTRLFDNQSVISKIIILSLNIGAGDPVCLIGNHPHSPIFSTIRKCAQNVQIKSSVHVCWHLCL
jgi:hypothetical protein